MHRALHRLLTGSAAALTAAAAVALPGSPAHAAEPTAGLYFPDLAVVGQAPKASPVLLAIDAPGPAPVVLSGITVTVDTAGTGDIATVKTLDDDFEFGDGRRCGTAGAVITCTLTGPVELDPGINLLPMFALEVTARAGAAQDAEGKLVFRARIGDGAPVTRTTTVSIGEGVDLAGVINTPVTVRAGADVDAGVRVRNAGASVVKGAVLTLAGWDPSLSENGGFGNCTYGLLTFCTFDDDLAPGQTYELSTPMRLKIPGDAAGGSRASAIGAWYTPSDLKELLSAVPGADEGLIGPKGTGPAVRLQPVAAKKAALRAAGSQVDTNPDNNVLVSEFVVSGTHPDLAAVGATVTGEPGDKVGASVGVRNNGPGTLYHWTFDNTDPATHVVVPAGLKAVAVDDLCFPLSPAEDDSEDVDFPEDVLGAPEYLCLLDGGNTKAGASSLFDFTFQVRDDPSAAAGRVTIGEDIFGEAEVLDREPGNNTAKIVVEVAGGSGGSGGGLPVTGANAGLLGGGGALLLVAGVLGLLLVRRRRVRFTA